MGSFLQFPVLIARTGQEQAPQGEDTYYIIGKNGTFLHKRTGIVEALIPVPDIPQLASVETWAELDVPRIPLALFAQVWHFFREIYKKMHSEAVALLFYDESTRQWFVEIPEQRVQGAGVHYDDRAQKPGCVKAGTIHSHCDFQAGHSGGDQRDERHFDGLHITIGHVPDAHPTVSVCVAVNGFRFMKSVDDYLEGVRMGEYEVEVFASPKFHRRKVHDTQPNRGPKHYQKGVGYKTPGFVSAVVDLMFSPWVPISTEPPSTMESLPDPVPPPTKTVRMQKGVCVDFPKGTVLSDYGFPDEWISRVYRYIPPAPVHVQVVTPVTWSSPTNMAHARRGSSRGHWNDEDWMAETGFDLLKDLPPPLEAETDPPPDTDPNQPPPPKEKS